MSTFAYGRITGTRASGVNTFTTDPPGLGPTIDTLAALVPAEVLALHVVVLGLTTGTTKVEGETVRHITKPELLEGSFWALVAATIIVYVAGRISAGWKWSDLIRMFLPAAAFVAWTMVQTPTAFDAVSVFPDWSMAERGVFGAIGAVILGALALALAYRANSEQP